MSLVLLPLNWKRCLFPELRVGETDVQGGPSITSQADANTYGGMIRSRLQSHNPRNSVISPVTLVSVETQGYLLRMGLISRQ